MKKENLNRRRFGEVILTSATVLPLAILGACSDDNNNPSGPSNNNGDQVTVGLEAAVGLASVGGHYSTSLEGTPVTIFRTGDTTFRTFSRICTHQGCTTSWNDSNDQFRCPCHGSRFSETGGVVQGPAERALPEFDTEYDAENNRLLISL